MKKSQIKILARISLAISVFLFPIFISGFIFATSAEAQGAIPPCDSSYSVVPCNQGGVGGATVFTRPSNSGSGTSGPGGAACSSGLTGVLCKLNTLLSQVLPFLVSLGVIYFIWGMVQYFIADDEEAKKSGRDRIIYGIIGLAVIISVWGLVTILVETLGVGQNQAYDVSNLVISPTGTDCKMGGKFQDVLNYATCVIGTSIIPFLFAIAVVVFVWGSIKFFIIDADEEAKREQGKQFMLWGIIALAVMVSIWGLVTILGETFNIRTNVIPQVGGKP